MKTSEYAIHMALNITVKLSIFSASLNLFFKWLIRKNDENAKTYHARISEIIETYGFIVEGVLDRHTMESIEEILSMSFFGKLCAQL